MRSEKQKYKNYLKTAHLKKYWNNCKIPNTRLEKTESQIHLRIRDIEARCITCNKRILYKDNNHRVYDIFDNFVYVCGLSCLSEYRQLHNKAFCMSCGKVSDHPFIINNCCIFCRGGRHSEYDYPTVWMKCDKCFKFFGVSAAYISWQMRYNHHKLCALCKTYD